MKVVLSAFIAVWLFCIQAIAAPSDTTAQFDAETGLFSIKHHTVEIARADFVFWSGKWLWSPFKTTTSVGGGFNYGFSLADEKSGLALKGTASRSAPNRLEWRLRFEQSADAYGGIAIGFQHAPFAGEKFVPQLDLLPGGDGWSLQLAADEAPVKFTVSPAPALVAFERGQRDQVRVYFAEQGANIAAGEYVMTVELPEHSSIVPSPAERLAAPGPTWYNDLLDINISPVDLSFLNELEKPAGKRGALGVNGDQLVFADGTPVRFWGTNLTAYALFGTGLSDTVKQAKRLSQLGFNLVRIHHIDSDWVKPNILGRESAAGLELDKESLRRLDWWIKTLGDEGIYAWLDLNVGRVFPVEGLEYADEMMIGGKGPTAKGFAYFNSGIEAKMKELNRLLLNHVNQYTNLAYKDDPRIAFLLVTNENDLTHHFGNMFLPDKNRPQHNKIYKAEAARFAEEKKLNPEQTWRSWEFGPSKLFLSDIEHRFNERMIGEIRSIGSKAVVSTTNTFGGNSAAGLLSLADGGIVAVNSYATSNLLEADPRFSPNLVSWIANAALAGKPVAATEWNMGKRLSFERSALPAYLASVASFQDWNAPIEYAYSQSPLDRQGRLAQWEMAVDPALLAMMPVGALIYRLQHVEPGEKIRYLRPAADEFVDRALSPITSRAVRSLTESVRWRLDLPAIKELQWFKPSVLGAGGEVVSDMSADFAGRADQICAENGSFCRNWRRGTFTVDTPKTQLVSGWIGGETIKLSAAKISLETAYATLAIQSLDSKPIAESQSILVSMAAQTLPAGDKASTILSEPVVGQIVFKAPPDLTAYAHFGDGRAKRIPTTYKNGAYELELSASLGTYWIVFRNDS